MTRWRRQALRPSAVPSARALLLRALTGLGQAPPPQPPASCHPSRPRQHLSPPVTHRQVQGWFKSTAKNQMEKKWFSPSLFIDNRAQLWTCWDRQHKQQKPKLSLPSFFQPLPQRRASGIVLCTACYFNSFWRCRKWGNALLSPLPTFSRSQKR